MPLSSGEPAASLSASLPPPVLPEPPSPAEARAEGATCLLYVFFFWLWVSGLLLGLGIPEGSGPGFLLFGLPLWVGVGCILAYIAASAAVALAVRRYFR